MEIHEGGAHRRLVTMAMSGGLAALDFGDAVRAGETAQLPGGRTVVEADLLLLRHMFWDRDPEQGWNSI